MTPETEEKVVEGLAQIKATLEAQNETLALHTQALGRVDYTLNGNGKPGLKQQVAEHASTLANMKRVGWIIFTPILAAIGGGVVTVSVYLLQRVH